MKEKDDTYKANHLNTFFKKSKIQLYAIYRRYNLSITTQTA